MSRRGGVLSRINGVERGEGERARGTSIYKVDIISHAKYITYGQSGDYFFGIQEKRALDIYLK